MPNNFSNFGPGTYDPVQSLVGRSSKPATGLPNFNSNLSARPPAPPAAPTGQPQQRQAPAPQQQNQWGSLGSNVPMSQGFRPGTGLQRTGFQQGPSSITEISSPLGTANAMRTQQDPMSQFSQWDQGLANAMGYDIRTQQGEMNRQFGAGQQQIGMYEDALQRGIGTTQQAGAEQAKAMQGIAGGLEKQGQQGAQDFYKFRDQQMGAVGRDITKANELAAQATKTWQDAVGEFKDTSAQTAANAAFGLRRSTQEAMQQINSGMNPDGTMMSPAEQQAARMQLTQTTEQQVSQTVTNLFSDYNDKMAQMKGTLSQLQGSQGQQMLAGGQLRGSIGTAFGAQTLDAQRTHNQMSELGAQMRSQAEAVKASALTQAVALELQGRTTVAQMIQQNPQQFVSMFAGLTGFLAGATTPGIERIDLPNFGAMA